MTVISEQEYRRYTNDVDTPWLSSGNTLGAEEVVVGATGEIESYLDTYLQLTQVEDEKHRLWPQTDRFAGRRGTTWRRVYLNHVRLKADDLVNYPIDVTIIHQSMPSCTEVESAGCATVLTPLASLVNVGLSSSSVCSTVATRDRIMAKISYYCGFESLEVPIKRALAMLAYKNLPAWITIEDDTPYGAPMISKRTMDIQRAWLPPYQRGWFGPTWLDKHIENLLMPYKVFRARQLM